jgi:hypothetical protein
LEHLLAASLGLALAAACGFRVFVPLFLLSLASHAGHVSLAGDLAVLGSTPALVTLGVATVLEIGAYYVPLVDNLLDTVATPASVIAGAAAWMAVTGDATASPYLTWALALVAGGGTAGAVQVGTVKVRAASAALTGGTANPVVSTSENAGAVAVAGTALIFPALALVAVLVAVWWLRRRSAAAAPASF